jgi:hypothetical protein
MLRMSFRFSSININLTVAYVLKLMFALLEKCVFNIVKVTDESGVANVQCFSIFYYHLVPRCFPDS